MALAAGLLRKLQDVFAINWGSKTGFLLEFTRAFDSRVYLHFLAYQHKTDGCTSLLYRLQTCLGSGWSGKMMPFLLGIRGSSRMLIHC